MLDFIKDILYKYHTTIIDSDCIKERDDSFLIKYKDDTFIVPKDNVNIENTKDPIYILHISISRICKSKIYHLSAI